MPETSEASATAIATPARRAVLGHGAGRARGRGCRASANQSSARSGRQLRAWPRTHESAACADSRITSPSWPVIVSLPSPGIARRLDEQDLAADRASRRARSRRRGPWCGGAARRSSGAGRAARAPAWRRSTPCPSTFPSATSRATLRQTLPISRSRLRTPASRVYSSMIARSAGVGERDLAAAQAVLPRSGAAPGSAWRCGASRPACSRRAGSPPSGPGAAAGSCRGCSPWR